MINTYVEVVKLYNHSEIGKVYTSQNYNGTSFEIKVDLLGWVRITINEVQPHKCNLEFEIDNIMRRTIP